MDNLQTGLNAKERGQLNLLFEQTESLKALIDEISQQKPTPELSIAKTRIEEAYMWATSHLYNSAKQRNQVN